MGFELKIVCTHVSLWYIAIALIVLNDFTIHNVAVLVNTLGVFVGLEHLLSFVYQITTPIAIHPVYTSGVWSCHATS